MFRKIFICPVIAALSFLVFFSSCSGDREKLDLVPSDVDAVASVDIESLLKELGVTFEDGEADLTLASEKIFSNYAPLFVELHKSCDLSDCIGYYYKGKEYLFLPVTDKNALSKNLGETLALPHSSQDGYEVYSYQDDYLTIAVDDNRCWIIEKGTTVTDIKAAIERASESNLSSLAFMGEFLSKDALLKVAVRSVPGVVDHLSGNGWFTLKGDVKNPELTIECASLDSIGNSLSPRGLANLTTDFLSYMPVSDKVTAMATVGINGLEVDWESAAAPIVALAGLRARGLLDYLLPFLGQIDGPFAVGFATGENFQLSDPSPANCKMVAMVHMQPSGINKALQTIRKQLSWFGDKLTVNSDGSLKLAMDDYSAYAASVDGYLAVSNYPLEKSAGLESLSAYLAGECKGGLYLDIHSLRTLSPDFPVWGIKVTGQYRDNVLRMTVRLIDCDTPILQTLIDL